MTNRDNVSLVESDRLDSLEYHIRILRSLSDLANRQSLTLQDMIILCKKYGHTRQLTN